MQSRLTVHGLVVPVVERLGGQQLPKSASKRTPAGRAAGAALRVEAGCRTCTPASRCSRTPREDLAAVSRLGASATHGGRQAELVPLAIDLAISRPRVWRDDSRLLALHPSVGRGLTAAAAAAVTRRHRRRHRPRACPSSGLLLRGSQPHKTTIYASWARWQIPSLSAVSSAPGRRTAPRESPAASELGLRALEQGVTTQVLLRCY